MEGIDHILMREGTVDNRIPTFRIVVFEGSDMSFGNIENISRDGTAIWYLGPFTF